MTENEIKARIYEQNCNDYSSVIYGIQCDVAEEATELRTLLDDIDKFGFNSESRQDLACILKHLQSISKGEITNSTGKKYMERIELRNSIIKE